MILEAMGYNFFRIKNEEVEQESIITELKNHILKLLENKSLPSSKKLDK